MTSTDLPPPPEIAAEVFGDRLDDATTYAALLARDGVQRGLIGPREPARIWPRHLLNSAALAPLVPSASSVVDIGSGAGLPGIPLALARPDLQISLVEPMQRRVDFLTQVLEALPLPQVSVRRARAEELPVADWDVVVTRAVASLGRLVELSLPRLRPGGTLLALKGESVDVEIAKAGSVLKKWPLARVEVVRTMIGGEPATIVRVDLGSSGIGKRRYGETGDGT